MIITKILSNNRTALFSKQGINPNTFDDRNMVPTYIEH